MFLCPDDSIREKVPTMKKNLVKADLKSDKATVTKNESNLPDKRSLLSEHYCKSSNRRRHVVQSGLNENVERKQSRQ